MIDAVLYCGAVSFANSKAIIFNHTKSVGRISDGKRWHNHG